MLDVVLFIPVFSVFVTCVLFGMCNLVYVFIQLSVYIGFSMVYVLKDSLFHPVCLVSISVVGVFSVLFCLLFSYVLVVLLVFVEFDPFCHGYYVCTFCVS
jgi:hypothetical protein